MRFATLLAAGLVLASVSDALPGLFDKLKKKLEDSSDGGSGSKPRATKSQLVDGSYPADEPHPDFKPKPSGIKCKKLLVRKEWRMLTTEERLKFITNFRKLYEPKDGKPSFIDTIARTHVVNNAFIHGSAAFFPWHRWLVRHAELKLQEVSGDPELTIPYWSTSFDSQGPDLSAVFGDEDHAFGRNGDASKGGCVTTGGFKNLAVGFTERNRAFAVFQPHCLARRWNDHRFKPSTTLAAFVPAEVLVAKIEGCSRHRYLRAFVESAPHALPHLLIGGDFGTMASPNEPLFWLHHADIDRMWHVWQKAHPDHMWDFDDDQQVIDVDSKKPALTLVKASLADRLPAFPHVTVQDVMDSEGALCVTYEALDVTKYQKPFRAGIVLPNLHRRDDKPAAASGAPAPAVEVKVEPAPATLAAPTADDKAKERNLVELRVPPALPTEWIQANHLNETYVQATKAELDKMIKELNQVPGYVSITALWNQPSKLAKLPSWDGLKVRVGEAYAKVTASLPTVADAKQAVATLQQKVRSAFKVDHVVQNTQPQVQQNVQGVLGKVDFTGWFKGLPQRLGYQGATDAAKDATANTASAAAKEATTTTPK